MQTNGVYVNITIEGRCEHISTHGGESYIEGEVDENYGLEIGDVHIDGICGDDMERLARAMIEHLKANGRDVAGRD